MDEENLIVFIEFYRHSWADKILRKEKGMNKRMSKRIISFMLAFAMMFGIVAPVSPAGMKVHAETTTPTYTKVEVQKPVANSWTEPATSTDGGPGFAFNGETGNWWHSNYSETVSGNKLTGEFELTAVIENDIPKFSDISSERIWIGGEFSEKINLGKFVYQGRSGANKNYIQQWALYTASVTDGSQEDSDFDTIAASGTFTSTSQVETVLDRPVEATHFRLVVFTCNGSPKNFATASKIEMYSVADTISEGDGDHGSTGDENNATGMTTSEKEARRAITAGDLANSQIGAYEYWLDKDGSIEEGGIYAITFLSGSDQRVLYCAPGASSTDRFNGSVTGEKYSVTAFAEERQSWQVVEHEGGFALKAMTSTDDAPQYLDLSEARGSAVKISNTPHKITIEKVSGQDGKYTVSSAVNSNKLGYAGGNYNSGTSAAEVSFYQRKFVTPDTIRYVASHEYSPSGNTLKQPFAERTGGSHNFRIPCIITLSDGRLVAAADMRWNHDLDGRAIDLIASYSDDNGEKWTFNSPLYYNDSEDPMPSNPDGSYLRADANEFNYAMTIMDPVIAADKNDHIYVLADMFPGGVAIESAVPLKPDTDVDGNRSTPGNTGFEMVEGEERLVLYASPNPSSQDDNNYTHYVGDYEGEYAPVYDKTSKEVEFYVDKKFYLFDENKQPKYCAQIGTDDTVVRQNIFFYNADLHVRCATYLVLVKSTDRGETWSDPVLINQQVNKEEFFYGVGPSAGLSMDNGMIIFPMYEHINGNERSSLIFSTDQGETWKRTSNSTAGSWSSESAIVKLSETKLRQFMRSGSSQLSYVDWNWNEENENWETTQVVTTTQEAVKDTNQISAIRFSKDFKGRPVIIVSTATSTTRGTRHDDVRADGRLYTYVVKEDGTMKLLSSYDVWPLGSQYPHGVDYSDVGGKECYTYSSLTETEDGKIALLVETDFRPARMTYKLLEMNEICPNVIFDDGDTQGQIVRVTKSLSTLTAYDTDYTIIDDDDTEALRKVGEKDTNYFAYEGGTDNDNTPGVDGWAYSFPVEPIDGLDPEILNYHWTNKKGISYTLHFKGTGIDLIGKKNVSKLNFQLDGQNVTAIDLDGVSGNDIILCRMTELEDTTHTLKVTVPEGMEGTFGISYARVYGSDYASDNEEREVTDINFNKLQTEAKEVNSFIFSEGWTGNAAHRWSETPTDARPIWYEVDFVGNQIDIYAGKNAPHGDVTYTIYERDEYDNNQSSATPVKGPVKISLYRGSNIDSTRTWTFRGLEEGKVYTLRAEAAKTGQGNQKIIDCSKVVVYATPVAATGLKINEEEKSITVKEGQTKQIVYTLIPENATLDDLTFTSADPSIASADKDGVVTGIKEGTTTITITSETLTSINEVLTVTVEDVTQVMKGTIGDTGLQYTEEDRADIKALVDGGRAKTEETLNAWKNDKATSLIALISDESALRNVKVSAGDLVHSNGSSSIASDNITATFIKSTKAYNGGFLGYGLSKTLDNYPEPTATNRDESADILYTTEPVNIGWNELQAVWMEFDIPKDARSGEYTTEITVTADGLSEPLSFTYVIEVENLVLPDETDFYNHFSIDFWHHPYASADYYGVEPFSADHFKILESIMELYKEVGGNTVYATMVEEPWNAQTWSPYGRNNPQRSTYPSMIKWISTDGGRTFTYDYTDFDAWINFNIEHGLGDEIALFSIAPWHRTFRWYNGTGEDATVNIGAPNYGTGYERIWTDFLTDLFNHLDKNNWLDRTYIAIDEQGFEARAFEVIEKVEEATGKQVKTMGFIDGINDANKRNLSKKLDYASFGDFAVEQNLDIYKTLLAERDSKGQKTVIYSCTEHRPGQFSLSQPVESYWAVANAGRQGATGFSRWAWDAWSENPLEDATGFAFEPGDCFVIFPDLKEKGTEGTAKSSVRLEMMAQAVRDMNKVFVMMNSDVAGQLESYKQALYNTITFAAYKNSSATYLSDENIAKVQSEVSNFKTKLKEMTDAYVLLKGEEEPETDIYTVTFDSQGGSKVSSVRVDSGQTIDLPEAPVKDGYTFGGWFAEVDGKGTEFTKDTVVSSDVKVYAYWIKNEDPGTDEPGIEDPGVSDNDPGVSDNDPGVSDNDPGVSDNDPGVSDNDPGVSDNDPGVSDNDPGVSDNDPETKGYENIWVEGLTDKVYTGSKITQNLKIYDGDKLLLEGSDYTISYKNNVNACEFTDEELAAFEEAYRNDPKTKANIGNIPSKKAPQVVLKMKGNYTGTRSLFFRIEKQDIANEENFIIDDLTVTNTGKNKAPVPVVTWKYNGKNLKNKKDFTIEQSAADHSLVVKGNGNFKGEKIIDYIVTPDKNTIAMNQVKVSKIKPVDYKEGESLKPAGFTVKYKKATLTEGTHFEVSEVTAEDIMGSGMATVVLTAKEGAAEAGYSFVGSKRVSFKVNTYAMNKVKASGLVPQTFTGDAINILDDKDNNGNPVVSLTIPATKTTSARTLTAEDYTVTYEKNIVKGTASVTLTGIPERGVTGSKKLTFKINPTTLSKEEGSGFEVTLTSDVSGNDTIVYHTKGGAKPAVIIVREDGQSLVEGRDYTVTYKSNKGPGQGQAVVKGKGNYTGQFNLSYTIEKKPVSEADSNGVWIQVNDKVYNTKKNSWKQNFKVLDSDGKALANKKDADIKGAVYTVIGLPANAPDNIHVGDVLSDAGTVLPEGSEVQITVTLAGSYEGKVIGTYRIIHKEKDISKAKFQLNPQQYTGEAVIIDSNDDFKKRDLKGTAISMEEGEGQIFEVVEGSYSNNLKKGTAKVTLRGVGEYGGIKTVTFKIGARSVTDWFDSEFRYW